MYQAAMHSFGCLILTYPSVRYLTTFCAVIYGFAKGVVESPFFPFLAGYIAMRVVISSAKAVFRYFSPPKNAAPEIWGDDVEIAEYVLGDEPVSSPAPEEPVPQTVEKDDGKKEHKHNRRLERAEHRKLERIVDRDNEFYYDRSSGSRKAPRNSPYRQAAVNAGRVDEIARSLLGNIGVLKVACQNNTYSCFTFGSHGYNWIVPFHMVMAQEKATYTFSRAPGLPGVTLTSDEIFGGRTKIISVNGQDLDAVEIEVPEIAKVHDKRPQWAK
jgi:hypothetical protein